VISHRLINDNFVRLSLVERSVANQKICHVTCMKNININVQTAQTPEWVAPVVCKYVNTGIRCERQYPAIIKIESKS